jgi:hypothetical protein
LVRRSAVSGYRAPRGGALYVVHAGLELSRRALAVCVLCERGERLDRLAVRPDVESLRRLAGRIDEVPPSRSAPASSR